MQVTINTTKGEILAVQVLEGAVGFVAYMGYLTYKIPNPKTMCGEDVLCNPYRLTKFLERTENMPEHIDGSAIKIGEDFQLIAPLSEVTEDQATMIVDTTPLSGFTTSLEEFKYLMQANEVYEVYPYDKPRLVNSSHVDYHIKIRKFRQWESAQQCTRNWIILFNPKE